MEKMKSSTVAAIATAAGVGAIGVVRMSGDAAIEIADKVFARGKSGRGKKKLSDMKGNEMSYGRIVVDGRVVDDAMAAVYCAPHSYTGEDMVEFFCHGNDRILREVLKSLVAVGAEYAGPGEFTKRAFLNGKLSLSQAEAVMEIIAAKGEAEMDAARNRLDGVLGKAADKICDELVGLCAHFAAWSDYPEEDVEELSEKMMGETLKRAEKELEILANGYNTGKILVSGVTCAIAGKPNAGKSTLMNAIMRDECSIVTSAAGTTRDVVESEAVVGGMRIRFADTAGIREASDEVERIGVERAKKRVEQSDIVVAVFDGSSKTDESDAEILELIKGRNSIAAINKIDLGISVDITAVKEAAGSVVFISAATGEGMEELERAICDAAGLLDYDKNAPLIANERQFDCIRRALDGVRDAISALEMGVTLDAVEVCVESAVDALYDFSGGNVREDVVNEVFSRFCVGK